MATNIIIPSSVENPINVINIPQSHYSIGVNNTDLLVYVGQ